MKEKTRTTITSKMLIPHVVVQSGEGNTEAMNAGEIDMVLRAHTHKHTHNQDAETTPCQ